MTKVARMARPIPLRSGDMIRETEGYLLIYLDSRGSYKRSLFEDKDASKARKSYEILVKEIERVNAGGIRLFHNGHLIASKGERV